MLINPYQKKFGKSFGSKKKKLRKCLGPVPRIEHFGSTAVPGLAGKGVIDVMIGFQNRTQLHAAVLKLVARGYFLSKKGQLARGDRVFLSSRKKESGVGDVHVHLVLRGSEGSKKALRFRNRLRRSAPLRERYLQIKKEAAKAARGKREHYTKLKSAFIEEASKLR
jgi:GrpB-like predicted nucleotidyltransferase (UPF0157 family)